MNNRNQNLAENGRDNKSQDQRLGKGRAIQQSNGNMMSMNRGYLGISVLGRNPAGASAIAARSRARGAGGAANSMIHNSKYVVKNRNIMTSNDRNRQDSDEVQERIDDDDEYDPEEYDEEDDYGNEDGEEGEEDDEDGEEEEMLDLGEERSASDAGSNNQSINNALESS
jgi:hypothetical protein